MSSSLRNVDPPKGMCPLSSPKRGVYVCCIGSYVESLESRLAKMEKLLQTVRNSTSFLFCRLALTLILLFSYARMVISLMNLAVRSTRKAGTRSV